MLAIRRRRQTSGGDKPWLNTFADLMNLLLCFFVMLFAMSDIDVGKFQNLAISMSNSFGIFEGSDEVGSEPLITSGMTQIEGLDEYLSDVEGANESKSENTGETDNGNEIENEKNSENENKTENESDLTKGDTQDSNLKEAYEVIQGKMREVSGEMYEKIEKLTEEHGLENYVELSIDPEYKYVQLSMRGSILFDSGKAEIRPEAKEILSKIGEVLKNFDGYIIEIVGHTDNVPVSKNNIYKDNIWLSSARAINAAEFLIENNKLDPNMLKYSGRGEYEPVADNSTAKGRAKNRRIEIRIYNEYSGN